jgi:MFS family permease
MENAEKQPLLTPLMRWFMFAMVLANIAGSMSPMLMPLYLQELGASIEQIGLVFTLTSVAVLTLQILGGWVSDSIGRLRAIAIGSVAGMISYVALLLAPTWQWMIAALVIHQLPYAIVGPSFGAFCRKLYKRKPGTGIRPHRYHLPDHGRAGASPGRFFGRDL